MNHEPPKVDSVLTAQSQYLEKQVEHIDALVDWLKSYLSQEELFDENGKLVEEIAAILQKAHVVWAWTQSLTQGKTNGNYWLD